MWLQPGFDGQWIRQTEDVWESGSGSLRKSAERRRATHPSDPLAEFALSRTRFTGKRGAMIDTIHYEYER
jgi:hypothetical protein